MKQLYTFLILAFAITISNAQIVTIPDANFKAKLLAASSTALIAYNASGTKIKIDTNNDGNIQLSEALTVYKLVVGSSSTYGNITDMTGVESFTNLKTLTCLRNQITILNVLPLTNLESLDCSANYLTALNISSLTNLKNLNCSNNDLTTLNTSGSANLLTLNCSSNALTTLNITNCLALTSLDCYTNQLTTLDVSNRTNLTALNCSGNAITSLNINNSFAFTSFYCSTNQLTTLDISNRYALAYLDCGYNLLTSLNITNDLALLTLRFHSNQIQSINLDPFVNLEYLAMGANLYSSTVNINTLLNLEELSIVGLLNPNVFPLNNSNMPLFTHLTYLFTDNSPIGNFNYGLLPALENLYCRNTQMTNLNTSNLTKLITLACEKNQLTTLDLTPLINLEITSIWRNPINNLILGTAPKLITLFAGDNNLTTMDISNCPVLSNFSCNISPILTTVNVKNGVSGNSNNITSCPNLSYICADDGEIPSIQSSIATSGYTNCHVNTYCTFEPGGTFYTIQGNHRWDTNNNGCDNSDFLFPNMKFNISNGTSTNTLISGDDGSYHYDVPAGTYTVTPVLENPNYFNVTQSNTGNIVFPTVTNSYIRDFCVSSIANNPDLEVVIQPVTFARPGFNNELRIICRNKGGVPQNGTVTLNYDDSTQDFVSSTVAPNSQSIGSLSLSFSNLLPFQSKSINLKFNLNMPTETPPLNQGDVLQYTATAAGAVYTDIAPTDNVMTLNQEVFNAFDPNNKTCVEGTIVSPSMVGQYVHYVIRFENNGTANASSVVVKDLIDTAKFDINSIIPQGGSDHYITKISNTNQVEFIFENINLPFDDANNDGYVAFKIKTKPTLVVGNTFSNAANIYFDYNFPITTNTFTTTIQTLGAQDFDFGSVFSLSPVPAKNILTITTKQEVAISSISIYNTLGQLVQVLTNPSETIDVSDLKTGNYFIKIVSDKGTANSKFIKQ